LTAFGDFEEYFDEDKYPAHMKTHQLLNTV